MSRKNKITMSEFRSEEDAMRTLMAHASLAVVDKVEAGFKTVRQWAKFMKIDRSTASERLNILLKQSKVEKKTFRIMTDSTVRSIAHYRPIPVRKRG
jgi:hypothetical protein